MKHNADLVISGEKCVLVPYRRHHVVQYHEWMQDPELLAATASEPLSLEEEYAMQQTWAEDEHKCTFIVCDPDFADTPGTGSHGGAMAGDVNLFLGSDHEEPHTAEISIMLAEARSRRKGVSHEALRLVMAYAAQQLGVTKFRAKIDVSNEASQALFRQLGYRETKRVDVFHEVWLELAADGDAARRLLDHPLRLGPYDGV